MSLRKFYVGLIMLSLLLLAMIFFTSRQMSIPYDTFVKDPSALFGFHPFSGILSNIGVMGWCSTATVSIFTWLLLQNIRKEREISFFLLYFGLLSGWLLLDDLLLFHELLFGQWFGISEKFLFGAYGLLFLFGLTNWRNKILYFTPYPLLFLAFGFFASSIFIDFFQDYVWLGQWLGAERILLEDGFKFLGIMTWFCYFASVATLEVAQAMSVAEE